MHQNDDNLQIVPAKLDDDSIIYIEARLLNEREKIGKSILDFGDFSNQIKKVISNLTGNLDSPLIDTVEVEFGVEIALESGKLSALFVKGSGKANMKIKCIMKRS